jgi:uncharacterized protein (TIGR03083 family)
MVVAFRALRSRVNGLVEGLDDERAGAIVPATPEWRVHDLLSHFAGVAEDVVQGNVEDAGSDPWTAAQIEARRDRPWGDVLAEWNERAVALEAMMPTIPEFRRGQLVFDAVTHEHDLRGAFGQPGARDSDALAIGWDWAAAIVGMMRDGNAAGGLRIRTEQGEQVVGQGEVTATVAADRFDLFRAMTGRRSVEQVKAFAWEGGTHVGHLCFLPCTPVDLVE